MESEDLAFEKLDEKTDDELRALMKKAGLRNQPIVDTTRKLIIRRLQLVAENKSLTPPLPPKSTQSNSGETSGAVSREPSVENINGENHIRIESFFAAESSLIDEQASPSPEVAIQVEEPDSNMNDRSFDAGTQEFENLNTKTDEELLTLVEKANIPIAPIMDDFRECIIKMLQLHVSTVSGGGGGGEETLPSPLNYVLNGVPVADESRNSISRNTSIENDSDPKTRRKSQYLSAGRRSTSEKSPLPEATIRISDDPNKVNFMLLNRSFNLERIRQSEFVNGSKLNKLLLGDKYQYNIYQRHRELMHYELDGSDRAVFEQAQNRTFGSGRQHLVSWEDAKLLWPLYGGKKGSMPEIEHFEVPEEVMKKILAFASRKVEEFRAQHPEKVTIPSEGTQGEEEEE